MAEKKTVEKEIEEEVNPEIIEGGEEKAQEEASSSEIEEDLQESEEEEEEEIDELEKAQAEVAEAKDKYLRLYSEFDNFRRRTAKEKLSLMETANEGVISSMITVLDDFNRAEQSVDKKDKIAKAANEGLILIHQKFSNILKEKGLKPMDTKSGTDFDPDLHEAITQIPAPSKKLKGKIVDTIEQGYYLGEKVIRFAKVVTGS